MARLFLLIFLVFRPNLTQGHWCDKEGKFGWNCKFDCNCNDTVACDGRSGNCTSGCKDGFWGSGCLLENVNHYDTKNECPDYRFTTNCDQECHCYEDAVCGKTNGECPGGKCAPGWTGSSCQTITVLIQEFSNIKVGPGQNTTFMCTAYTPGELPIKKNIKLSYSPVHQTKSTKTKYEIYTNGTVTKIFHLSHVYHGQEFTCRVNLKNQQHIEKKIKIVYASPQLISAPSFKDLTANSLTLQWREWNSSRGDIGDGSVINYHVSSSRNIQDTTVQLTQFYHTNYCSNSLCNFKVDNLKPYTTYYFCIGCSRSDRQVGTCLKKLQIKTLCQEPSEKPSIKLEQNLRSTVVDITVIVNIPDQSTFNCHSIDKVIVHLSKDNTFSSYDEQRITFVNQKQKESVIFDSNPYTLYYARAYLVNEVGQSPMSDTQQIHTEEAAPSKPRGLRVIDKNNSSLTVTWQPPEKPNGKIRKYAIYYCLVDFCSFYKHVKIKVVEAPFQKGLVSKLSPLKPHRLYSISIRAETIAPGNFANIKKNTTEGRPGIPAMFRNISRDSSSITLEWKKPSEMNGYITKYKVKCLQNNRRIEHIKIYDVKKDLVIYEAKLTRLDAMTQYTCFLRAETRAGHGPFIELTTWTLGKLPKSLPAELSVLNERSTDTTVTIQFRPTARQGSESYHTYWIIVQLMKSNQARQTRSLHSESLVNRVEAFNMKTESNQTEYITAELLSSEIKRPLTVFTVGDKSNYRNYYNAPLLKGEHYTFVVCLGSDIDGVPKFDCSYMDQQVLAEAYRAPPTADGNSAGLAAALAIICVLIAIVIVVGVIFWRRRRKRPERTRENGDIHEKTPLGVTIEEETNGVSSQNGTQLHMTEKVPPIAREDFTDYVITMRQENCKALKHQYDKLPFGLIAPCFEAKKIYNKSKNRYGNIIAYDHSRVVLVTKDDEPGTDYINANYIDGYKDPRAYIATQGPSKQTIYEFWRMAWQEDVAKIVMVTNLIEDGRRKCEQYWPSEGEGERVCVDITIKLLATEQMADFTIRTFNMIKGSEMKHIKQFHFTAWPDHGVPIYSTALLAFHRKVRSYNLQNSQPIMVHCSAGVGRSGTFIAIDYILDQVSVEGVVDIHNFTLKMRQQRVKMIQTVEQYIFLHDTISEALLSGNTSIQCVQFVQQYNKLKKISVVTGTSELQDQYQLIQDFTRKQVLTEEKTAGLSVENIEKNRCPTILPTNSSRPYLISTVDDPCATDYINAAFLDSYKNRDALLITQMPLPTTKLDFWRMCYDHTCNTIVMMNETDPSDPNNSAYWSDTEVTYFGPFSVEVVNTVTYPYMLVRHIILQRERKGDCEVREIRHFQFTGWSCDTTNPRDILALVDQLEKCYENNGTGAIVVHCMDGATRSGLFCAAYYGLEKLKVEGEVDMFHTVQHLRIQRPQIVTSYKQYEFCHNILLTHLEQFECEIYSNLSG